MNIQRFTAATSREALAKARMAFGDGTLILSNRPVAGGIEVVATAEDSLSSSLDRPEVLAQPAPAAARPAPAKATAKPVKAAPQRSTPEEDSEELSMSTLSFQDYVRERMLRRRHEARKGEAEFAARAGADDLPAAPQRTAPRATTAISRAFDAPVHTPAPAPQRPRTEAAPARQVSAAEQATPSPSSQQGIVSELQSMKELIEDRFNTLAWLGQAKQDPVQSNLMLKMIRAGYSPALARALLERMPEGQGAAESVRWLMDMLERNLKTDAGSLPLHQQGGIFALVGATGVGKTTTAAKLAAQCARQYGANSVGLITLDSYRIGAHEQLRAYGRMLGVVAHLAHDRAALQDMLNLLANKKMVLIDTTGVAPRDPRRRDMLEVLDLPKVNRLMVLNAGTHGDTLDDVLGAFKNTGAQQAVLTKVDEAAKLGPALDALIRHQMVLRGVTNGQRVPEDWEAADAEKLVRLSMRAPAQKSAYDPKATDLSFFFSESSSSLPTQHAAGNYAAGAHHA